MSVDDLNPNGSPGELWHPRARKIWATINKMPPGYVIVSDLEMMTLANSMRQQTALNEALKRDFKARNRADDELLADLVLTLAYAREIKDKFREANPDGNTLMVHPELAVWGRLEKVVAGLEERTKAQNGGKA